MSYPDRYSNDPVTASRLAREDVADDERPALDEIARDIVKPATCKHGGWTYPVRNCPTGEHHG